MGREKVVCGFIPLIDCATLVVAHELGFADEEGLALELRRDVSWSNIRDKLAFGLVDAAQMLTPMVVAPAVGVADEPADVAAPFVLSVNGDVFGVSRILGERLRRAHGSSFFTDAAAAGPALKAALAEAPIRIGVPWMHSMHRLLLSYWLERVGLDLERAAPLTVVPPPFMVDALEAGEIDAFVVGEPWGSTAVERGAADLFMAMSSVWGFAPEKALGVKTAWLQERAETADALVRALYRASIWAGAPEHRAALAELLAEERYVGGQAEVIERTLAGELKVTLGAGERWPELAKSPDLLVLSGRAATFPWRSQSLWIADQLCRGAGVACEVAAARAAFRPEIYRRALGPIGVNLPGASEKLEGALGRETALSSSNGALLMGPDRFFDGAVFDSAEIAAAAG